MEVYPLKFEPIFKPKPWGGRNLERLFAKPLPPGQQIGESWELVDLETDQSVVGSGAALGKTLSDLVRLWGPALLGKASLFDGRFPLLIKFLDAEQNLSVQVHPDAAMAARLGGAVRAKHEAWYIVEARGDAAIYRGLRRGVTRRQFVEAIEQAAVEQTLQRLPVRAGQCYYLPSGTLHALGAGVVVAEIQTPSDVTYRVYDWGRLGPDGKPRPLHIREALECIRFDQQPPVQPRSHRGSISATVSRLVECDWFVIELVRTSQALQRRLAYQQLVVWVILAGAGVLEQAGQPVPFRAGEVLVLPAALGDCTLQTQSDCQWLEVTIPRGATP